MRNVGSPELGTTSTSCVSSRRRGTDLPAVAVRSRPAEDEVVDAGRPVSLADRPLGRLDRERVDRAAAVALERIRAPRGARRGCRPRRPVDPAEVEPLGQHDQVAGEAVAADVRRLPDPVRLDLVAAARRRAAARTARSSGRACRACRRRGADGRRALRRPRRRSVDQSRPSRSLVARRARSARSARFPAASPRRRRRASSARRRSGRLTKSRRRVRSRAELLAQVLLELVRQAAAAERRRGPRAPGTRSGTSGRSRLAVAASGSPFSRDEVGAERPTLASSASCVTTQITWPVVTCSPGRDRELA